MLFGCILLLTLCIVMPTDGSERLLMAHAVWSHGSTTPLEALPNDADNREASWDEGLAQLTQKGKEQSLRLGQILHKRYITELDFIDTSRTLRQVSCRSSDLNRTLTSAYATLAGFLPLDPKDLGTKDWPFYWQPFPVHSTPAEYDQMLNSNARCPVADERIPERLLHSPSFQNEVNLLFLEHLQRRSGYEDLNWKSLFHIYDALTAIKEAGRRWPLWIDAQHYRSLEGLVNFGSAFIVADETVARMRGGPLLKEIAGHFQKKIQCTKTDSEQEFEGDCHQIDQQRFFTYSTDAFVLEGLLGALGAAPSEMPVKASAVVVELWESKNLFQIRAMYRGPEDPKMREIPISGCDDLNCSFENFTKRNKRFVPVNWGEECGKLTKGIKPECLRESDETGQKHCRAWARHGLCGEQPAVRFVFCRYTCLCDPAFLPRDTVTLL